MSASPPSEPPARAAEPAAAHGVAAARRPLEALGVGLAAWAACHVIGAVFSANATGSVAISALAAEIGAGRAGVRWIADDDRAAASFFRGPAGEAPWKRAFRGAAVGLAVASLALAASVVFGGAAVAVASPSVTTLLLGLLVAIASAVRDELLLRGVLVSSFPRAPAPLVYAAAALTAAVAFPDAKPTDIGLRVAWAIVATALWRHSRSAAVPVGAAAAFAFATGPLTSGGLLDVTGRGAASLRFPAGYAIAAVVAVLGVLLAARFERSTRRVVVH